MSSKNLFHCPVLSQEVLSELVDEKTRSFFDGTLGLGGHAEQILEKFNDLENYFATDLDLQHLEFAKNRLCKWEHKTQFFNENFAKISEILAEKDFSRPLSILLDLGLCSNQVDDAEKGFSFAAAGPLKMSFAGKNDAEKLLNQASEKDLTKIFREYGEEPLAPKIAREIVKSREISELRTTTDLKEIVEKCVHAKNQKKSLVRIFQAIRITVNNELEVLEKTIEDALNLMRKHDRLGIIAYHSLEDRIVKNKFKKYSSPVTVATEFSLNEVVSEAEFILVNKKPIKPTSEEISRNPRSRSAVFRIIEKI